MRRVAVIGVGTMGSMALWQLAERGIEVVGFEQYGIAHDFGAAGGGTRMHRMVYAEGSRYLSMLTRSRALWAQLEQSLDMDVLVRTGCLTIASASSPQITRSVAMAAECGLAHEVFDRATVHALYPQHRLFDDEVAVFDPGAGVLHTDRAIRAACDAAVTLGAVIHENTVVTAIEPDDQGVTVRAAGGSDRFDAAVVSTGPWNNSILDTLGFSPQTRRVRTSFHRARRVRLTQPEHFPCTLRRLPDGRSFGLMSSLDGNTVKFVIQNAESALSVPVEQVGDEPISAGFIQDTVDLVSLALPDVDAYPVRVSAHPEGFTPDGEGVLGTVDGVPNVVLLSAFSGHGFKMAPAIGELAAQLAATGERTPPMAELDPMRLSPGRPASPTDAELANLWFDVGNAIPASTCPPPIPNRTNT